MRAAASILMLLGSAVGTAPTTSNAYTNCYTMADNGASYDGTAATTENGLTCMEWALDSPHSHGFNDL